MNQRLAFRPIDAAAGARQGGMDSSDLRAERTRSPEPAVTPSNDYDNHLRLGESMADWTGLRTYIMSNYKVSEEDHDSLKLTFSLEGGRSQMAIVRKLPDPLEEGNSGWAEILTPVCQESDLNPREALVRNSQMIVGGLALWEQQGLVIFRHSFPLEDLDPSEFEVPLRIVVTFGDELEHELSKGGDLW